MLRVPVEVRSGEVCFRAAAWAESVERAVNLVKARYPGKEDRVIFPIEPDSFFADGSTSVSEVVRLKVSEEVAG